MKISELYKEWYTNKYINSTKFIDAKNYAKMGNIPFDTKEWITNNYIKE